MPTPGPSHGPRPPIRSSTASAATAHASQDRDTSLHLSALAELEAALSPAGPASVLVDAARVRSARQRLLALGARTYLEVCDRELAAADAPPEPETVPALACLTPAEQAVARLVTAGCSNRQAAAELYVSVKTVEFHPGHIFAKLGIRSRRDLITRTGSPQPRPRHTLGSN